MLSSKDLNELYQIFIIIEQNSLSGLNITDALNLYAKNCQRPNIKKILAGIQHDMDNGINLPGAFAKHPELFPDYIVEMMKVCEGTGQAEKIYSDIVNTLEQEVDLRRNIGSQLWQAVFFLTLLAITIFLVIFVVLPSMGRLMTSLGLQLPFYTRILIDSGAFMERYWYLLLGSIAAVCVFLGVFFKRNPDKFALLKLRLPLYRQIQFYSIQYRFALIFGLCKEAGLDTIRSLQYTATGSDNVLMQDLISKSLKDMSRTGISFAVALKKLDFYKIIDESMYMFLQAGERSDMGQLMGKRADFYKKQLLTSSQQFSVKLSNLLMTPTFVILGLIVISVLSPIFSIMFQISGKGGLGM